MNNRSKISVKNLCLTLILLLAGCFSSFAENPPYTRISELDEMDFREMLGSVELGSYADQIRAKQLEDGKNLLRTFSQNIGCNVETFRNKEIILVTIPARLLFAPNETELNETAGELLEPFKKYLKEPDKYRLLLTMHTDNTGSEPYREALTEERVEAVFDWFEKSNGVDTTYIFTYAFGDEEPLYENDSQEHRDKNRRLEVYIMPGQTMVDQYKKSK